MNDKHFNLQNAVMEFALLGGTAFNSRTVPSNRLRRRPLEKLSNTLKPTRRMAPLRLQ
ncbi:MAG: hypothetical protein ACK4FB_01860 [Brevundimonas sp.]|uniref:hypothetical protein n=1 Tax=Brevundimonas sp. TaxID=1871086 RepID=UPI00391D3B3B